MSAKFSPLLFLFFFFLILVSSCKKNLINNTQFDENNISNTKPKNGLSIDDAKNWYEQNSINTRALRDTGKSLINFKIHSPLWDKAINTGDSNYYIIEVPLQFDKSPGFIITNSTTVPQADKANDAVKLLILKDRNSGEMRSALMHVVSDDGIADKTNTYSKRNNHFTGFIFFTNSDGTFINGWKYEDGKITMSSSAKTSQRKISKRITMNPALSLEAPPEPGPVDCSTYTVVYEERYCIGDSGDNCTPWDVCW